MKLLALTLGYGILSAAVPFFNMEAYIVVAYARTSVDALQMAFIGSLGMNLGKLGWYYGSRQSLDLPFLKRRLDSPKLQHQMERWSGYVQDRTWVAAALTFASAAVGVPPFFVMAVIAGTLRMNVVVFFVAGLVGRTLFFWAILGGAHLLFR